MNFQDVQLAATAYTKEQLPPPTGREIVFCGRSNVGKSSLLNRLFGRKGLARVSSRPGKTGSVNFYRCGKACLVDLPGYGFARVSDEEKTRWSELTGAYFEGKRPVALGFLLMDIRRGPSEDDFQMLELLRHYEIPAAAVFTKADKLNKTQFAERTAALPAELSPAGKIPIFVTSVLDGGGIDELRKMIGQSAGD